METIIGQASGLAELRSLSVAVPPGSVGRVVIEGPGLGVAANIAGAEIIWRRVMGSHGLLVSDVHGQGLSTAIVEWSAPESAVVHQEPCGWGAHQGAQYALQALGPLIALAIAAALLALGWVLVRQITILLYGSAKGGLPLMVWVALGVVGLIALKSMKRR